MRPHRGSSRVLRQKFASRWNLSKKSIVAGFAAEIILPGTAVRRAAGKKIAQWIGGIHRATSSGQGLPEVPSREGDGERERESPFTVLDADGPDKFKGSAEFLCVESNRRQIDNDCDQPLLKPSPKKMPGGSGESTGQRVPAWGNRKIRLGSEDGERERESPFAGLEGLETGKFSRAATFFCGAPKSPAKSRQALENKPILFLVPIFSCNPASALQRRSAPKFA